MNEIEGKNRNKHRRTCQELLREYQERRQKDQYPAGKLMKFDIDPKVCRFETDLSRNSLEPLTFYNPTKPITINGRPHIFSRVETRDRDDNSVVIAFIQNEDGEWQATYDGPSFNMQDPFYLGIIEGQHIIGGVKVYPIPGQDLMYRTVFYRYKDHPSELIDSDGKLVEPFAISQERMKDVRMIEIAPGRIGVFTRPQEPDFGGKGKIGYIEISRLDELEIALYNHIKSKNKSELIEDLFYEDEWGGANELHLLPDGKIGVLGHIAHDYANENNEIRRNYHAITFIFDPNSKKMSDLKLIVTADDFPSVKPKKEILDKVVFSGGLVPMEDGTAIFYGGIGDIHSGMKVIPNPFVS